MAGSRAGDWLGDKDDLFLSSKISVEYRVKMEGSKHRSSDWGLTVSQGTVFLFVGLEVRGKRVRIRGDVAGIQTPEWKTCSCCHSLVLTAALGSQKINSWGACGKEPWLAHLFVPSM